MVRYLLRIEDILSMLCFDSTCSVTKQRTCSSGIAPGLCSVFAFSFNQVSDKRSFLEMDASIRIHTVRKSLNIQKFFSKATVENHCKNFCTLLCLLSQEEKQIHKTLRNEICLWLYFCTWTWYMCVWKLSLLLISNCMCLQI